jgi:hypothetical protein
MSATAFVAYMKLLNEIKFNASLCSFKRLLSDAIKLLDALVQ